MNLLSKRHHQGNQSSYSNVIAAVATACVRHTAIEIATAKVPALASTFIGWSFMSATKCVRKRGRPR